MSDTAGTATDPSASPPGRAPAPGRGWSSERLFTDGAEYFGEVERAIDHARSTVDFEMYMFEPDSCGHRMARALLEAHARGTRVRLLVDGAGSYRWRHTYGDSFRDAGVPFRIYHELPWNLLSRTGASSRTTLRQVVDRANRRDHRKLIVVDRTTAFVGSHNVSDEQCGGVNGQPPWRDISVRLTGDAVAELVESFDVLWGNARPRLVGRRHPSRHGPVRLVHTNITRRLRWASAREFLARIRGARHRVWFATGYFVPRTQLVRALEAAARRGVDVRVLVPSTSDVAFLPWISTAFYRPLLAAGVAIFEYLPRNLHAKTMIIDDWHTVGTSNLNHRSFIHDLELDVVLTSVEAIGSLDRELESDIAVSNRVRDEHMSRVGPLRRAIGRVLLRFRYWL